MPLLFLVKNLMNYNISKIQPILLRSDLNIKCAGSFEVFQFVGIRVFSSYYFELPHYKMNKKITSTFEISLTKDF